MSRLTSLRRSICAPFLAAALAALLTMGSAEARPSLGAATHDPDVRARTPAGDAFEPCARRDLSESIAQPSLSLAQLDTEPTARTAQRGGGGVSLQQATEIARRVYQGRVVRAETVGQVHEIRIQGEDGRVRTVRIDAQSGRVL